MRAHSRRKRKRMRKSFKKFSWGSFFFRYKTTQKKTIKKQQQNKKKTNTKQKKKETQTDLLVPGQKRVVSASLSLGKVFLSAAQEATENKSTTLASRQVNSLANRPQCTGISEAEYDIVDSSMCSLVKLFSSLST